MIAIGIDTGGTCTDAVVYDTDRHQVLTWGKQLTTRHNLKTGILNALNELDPEQVRKADYVALSTTLATNACVENKGGRAKLIFIGVKPKAVLRMDGIYGLPDPDDIYFMSGDPRGLREKDCNPDWEQFENDVESFRNYDSVAIVQINPRYNDGEYEKTAENILLKHFDMTCVRGYELYQELNVLKRGATALLNARLIPIMKKFFDSIERSFLELGIDLPIVIVKSNGNIMTKEYAEKRPVDTLLCGPAASVMGALERSGARDGIVIDIGGTTSDVAVVKRGVPITAKTGINVGKWNTMVKGISIDTFALGGDTAVNYHNGMLSLDSRRVIPLCVLAHEHPEVTGKLERLVKRKAAYGYPAHEFFLIADEPEDKSKYTRNEQLIIRRLSKGPMIYDELAETIGISPYIFRIGRLEDEGVVMRSGVTPTDVMHLKGDFTAYDSLAAELGIEYLSHATSMNRNEICDEIYNLAKERLYNNLVRILMNRETAGSMSEQEEALLEQMSTRMFRNREDHRESMFIDSAFVAREPIIGIGGPSAVFLDDVAAALETEKMYPEYREIANAIGATVGRIVCSCSLKIEPDMNRHWGPNYYLMGAGDISGINSYEQARTKAAAIVRSRVEELMHKEGAADVSDIEISFDEEFYRVKESAEPIFVQTTVLAKADSAMKF